MQSELSAAQIAAHCTENTRQTVALEVVAQTGSTNLDLLARLQMPTPQAGQPALGQQTLLRPTLLVAERQTAGRGRAGRTWHSASDAATGVSLTFSLAWRFARPMQDLLGLPLAVGVAIAEALEQQSVRVQLKWPNDILRDGHKLGGVLIATVSENPQQHWAVIGVGLNLAVSKELEQKIGHPVADARWLAQQDRNLLMATLLNHLVQVLQTFEQTGMAAFVDCWNHWHAFAGKQVEILDQGQVLHEGVALGVDSMGRLLLDGPDGQVAVLAGDVSLRESR